MESAYAHILVDDDDAMRELMVEAFEVEGYRVRQAAEGTEALQLVSWAVPDVVVLDIEMPGINGLEVARRLKANLETSVIPLVVGSAQARGAEALAVACCSKPFDLEELVSAVASSIGSP